MNTLEKTARKVVPLIRGGLAGETHDYREAARIVVDTRARHFTGNDGEPDYLGRSYAYRQWIGSIYGEAAPRAERNRVAAAMRYHVGEVLREYLDAADVTRLGLRPTTAVEEAVKNRSERSVVLSAVFGDASSPDPAKAATAARVLLDRIDLDGADLLTLQVVDVMIEAAAVRVKELQQVLARKRG